MEDERCLMLFDVYDHEHVQNRSKSEKHWSSRDNTNKWVNHTL